MNVGIILTILDLVHDFLLCPLFGNKDKDLQELEKKINEIQNEIEKIKGGEKNGNS